jgi:sugar phosphate isomerase/epimerase
MRLGGFFGAETIAELDAVSEKLDCYGLSAIPAPWRLAEMSDDECAAFGARARELGMVVGEAGFWESLLTRDAELRARRIASVRTRLRKADIMGCHCVVTLVGSDDPTDSVLAPTAYMFSGAAKAEFREVTLRILDGLDLHTTYYCIEPWLTSFFYLPEDIKACIDSIDHPRFGLHLDQMNLVSHATFYKTTELINTTFALLADKVHSVHLKDIAWDYSQNVLHWNEVYIGDGVMDYDTMLKRLATLPADMPCFCEHFTKEEDYAICFARLHHLAKNAGVAFQGRGNFGF